MIRTYVGNGRTIKLECCNCGCKDWYLAEDGDCPKELTFDEAVSKSPLPLMVVAMRLTNVGDCSNGEGRTVDAVDPETEEPERKHNELESQS